MDANAQHQAQLHHLHMTEVADSTVDYARRLQPLASDVNIKTFLHNVEVCMAYQKEVIAGLMMQMGTLNDKLVSMLKSGLPKLKERKNVLEARGLAHANWDWSEDDNVSPLTKEETAELESLHRLIDMIESGEIG